MINIIYKDPKDMRYSTLGDYFDTRCGGEQYEVADTGNPDMNFLIVLHELIESHICRHRGINEPDIKQWDLDHGDSDDPGSEPGCIYAKEHAVAESIEKIIAKELDIDWDVYNAQLDKTIELLPEDK